MPDYLKLGASKEKKVLLFAFGQSYMSGRAGYLSKSGSPFEKNCFDRSVRRQTIKAFNHPALKNSKKSKPAKESVALPMETQHLLDERNHSSDTCLSEAVQKNKSNEKLLVSTGRGMKGAAFSIYIKPKDFLQNHQA